MAGPATKVLLQSLGDPVADRAILAVGLTSNPVNQALGQLDGEDLFAFWNSQRGGLLLGGLYVAGGLASGDAKLNGQTRDDLGPSLFSVQQLNGLVHAPGVLGDGGSAQYDVSVIPYVSPSNSYLPCLVCSGRRANGLRRRGKLTEN